MILHLLIWCCTKNMPGVQLIFISHMWYLIRTWRFREWCCRSPRVWLMLFYKTPIWLSLKRIKYMWLTLWWIYLRSYNNIHIPASKKLILNYQFNMISSAKHNLNLTVGGYSTGGSIWYAIFFFWSSNKLHKGMKGPFKYWQWTLVFPFHNTAHWFDSRTPEALCMT